MSKIKKVYARQIIDSRAIPTVEATVILENGISAIASVPSGASTGIHEAVELRDGDKADFHGKSVLKAVENINTIINKLLSGMDVSTQVKLDALMIEADGTANKSKLGANSILAASLACARASSREEGLPLFRYISNLYQGDLGKREVVPLFNVINGGLHAAGSVSFQEFFIIPHESTFASALKSGCEIYALLKRELHALGKNTNVGDEGGFAPHFDGNAEVLEFLGRITKKYSVRFGLDIASSTFYKDKMYTPEKNPLSGAEYIEFVIRLTRDFRLEILEDALSEDDWNNWVTLTKKIADKTRLIGDDLLVTNPERLKKAVAKKACNGILVKLNQIGTLSETLNVVKDARKAGFTVIISHRSGETTDDFIADLAVGTSADYVKFGAPARGERVAKYNRLLEIYESLNKK